MLSPAIHGFTKRAQGVIELARHEAALLGHSFVGTEHILLGLVSKPEGVGGHVLRGRGLTLDQLRQEVRAAVGEGKGGAASEPPLEALTDKSRLLLAHTREECSRLQHNYPGTEHLLLGLLVTEPSVAYAVLDGLGVSRAELRQDVLDVLGIQ